jgi:hypothetical protein
MAYNQRDSWVSAGLPDRRLDLSSAQMLARTVFGKYDDNHSGNLNSMEAAKMISDLYASINEPCPLNTQEGKDLLIANDVESDNQINVQDFERIFVQTLSSKSNNGYNLTDPYVYQGFNNNAGLAHPNNGRR